MEKDASVKDIKKRNALIFLYGLVFLVFLGLVLTQYFLKQDEKKRDREENIGLLRFNSSKEFGLFLKKSNERESSYYYRDYDNIFITSLSKSRGIIETSLGNVYTSYYTPYDSYSRTNIQVEGVDEADIIKNDGKYIYLLSNSPSLGNKKLNIVEAYPAKEMKIVGQIDFKEGYPLNFYLSNEKLIVLGTGLAKSKSTYCEDDPYYIYCTCKNGEKEIVLCDSEICENEKLSKAKCKYIESSGSSLNPYSSPEEYSASVLVYDISDKTNPKKVQEYVFDGEIINSRLIEDNLYLLTKEYININNPKLPIIQENGLVKSMPISDIYYSLNEYSTSYYFTIVSSININNGKVNSKAYIINSYSNIYVSKNNIYISEDQQIKKEEYLEILSNAFKEILPKEYYKKIEKVKNDKDIRLERKVEIIQELFEDYVSNLEGKEMEDFSEKARAVLANLSKEYSKLKKTRIHKIGIDEKGEINYLSSGAVPGRILNQFSMDEYEDNLRVFTTTGSDSWFERDNSLNHLYILDKNMKIIGSVEDLAQGERIYSSRFLGDIGYVVTFRQIDPLYAIDLKDPRDPKVLGYLKIPGFSNYLHFLNKEKLIGVGYETQESGARGGIKISLFDVSDPHNIKEISKAVIGKDLSIYNYIDNDHKAFMIDQRKKIATIPFSYSSYSTIENRERSDYLIYPRYMKNFYGVLVLDLSNDEVKVIGNITHQDLYKPKYGPAKDEPIGATRNYSYYKNYIKIDENKWKEFSDIYESTERDFITYYTDNYIDKLEGGINYFPSSYDYSISRSAFIEEFLYTISNIYVKANNIKTLDYINHINLNSDKEVNNDEIYPPIYL